MWLKLFAVLRTPVSVVCLLGVMALGDSGLLAALAYLGLAALSVVTMLKLWKLKADAIGFASALLAFECLGAFLFIAGYDLMAGRKPLFVAQWAGVVLLLWGLPNALVLLLSRRRFVGAAETRPLPHPKVKPTSKL